MGLLMSHKSKLLVFQVEDHKVTDDVILLVSSSPPCNCSSPQSLFNCEGGKKLIPIRDRLRHDDDLATKKINVITLNLQIKY